MAKIERQVTQVREGSMYKFTVPEKLTQDEALELQLQMGYHPSGYGFYGFTATEGKTVWKCGTSCD